MTQNLYSLNLSSGPGATGHTGVRVEGGQGVCGRGRGGGGLIYWEDMAYHCHPLLRDVLQRCCCCCGPSSLGAVRCFLIPLGPLSLLPQPTAGYRYLVPPWPLDVPPRLQLLYTDIRSWDGEDAAAVPLRCGAVVPPGGWLLERVPCMLVRFRCTGTATCMLPYSQPFPASPPSF